MQTQFQEFIYKSRYARWLETEQRREDWDETVERYMTFMQGQLQAKHNYTMPTEIYNRLTGGILNMAVMPSMRALMTAGPALLRCNVAGYNCAYLPIDDPRAFDEILYILMCGTGVGFSIENHNISKLPIVSEHFEKSDTVIVVQDSKAGWARAFRELVALLYSGQIPSWDVSKVRPAGARLRTFGGRASGPEPLVDLFNFTVALFRAASGRRLHDLECHDLVCKIAEIVVVGGVRRSALISLSDLTSERMRHAKSGQWWENHPHRALANNSYVMDDNMPVDSFFDEWVALYRSKSGERGIFNRDAARRQALKTGRRKIVDAHGNPILWGTNPCSEIILRPYQFCNLSEIVVRAGDTLETLKVKAELATIMGVYQSTLTDFKYLRRIWKQNTEEERLLGVSLTGISDNPLTSGVGEDGYVQFDVVSNVLQQLREVVLRTADKIATDLGIPVPTATTCVKPSGTVSQLVDSGSGMHDRHAAYYIRTVRGDNKDPLTQFLIDAGVPNEPCVYQPGTTTVFSFPVQSPSYAVLRGQFSAIQQLERWLVYQDWWCEHKPSITVSVEEQEWPVVGGWVWENRDMISGISFLPHSEHTYRQAPYQEITGDEYKELAEKMPDIDWDDLQKYEKEDTTVSSQTLACTGSVCEIVDIGAN